MYQYIKGVRAEFARKRGQKLLVNGKTTKAEKCFRLALNLADNPENHFNLALTLLSEHKFTEAEKHFATVNQKFPENELNNLAMFECLILQGKWQKALDQIEVLCSGFPENMKYKKLSDIAKDEVLRENFCLFKFLNFQAYELLQNNKLEPARLKYAEALTLFPDEIEVLNNLGSIHLKRQEYNQAFSYFEKALSLEPDNRTLQKNLLQVKHKLRK
jgi:Flp pilus assembly protein TadD